MQFDRLQTKTAFLLSFDVFAHFSKCRKRALKTPKSATQQARISNAACDDYNFRVRRLIFRLQKLGDFACQKVCNFAMKWAILISALCKMAVRSPQHKVYRRKLLAVNQVVTEFVRFKRVFLKKVEKNFVPPGCVKFYIGKLEFVEQSSTSRKSSVGSRKSSMGKTYPLIFYIIANF